MSEVKTSKAKPVKKEPVAKPVEKEINLKQLYKFQFNEKAPNQKEGTVVEVTGELVKIYLSQNYGILCE